MDGSGTLASRHVDEQEGSTALAVSVPCSRLQRDCSLCGYGSVLLILGSPSLASHLARILFLSCKRSLPYLTWQQPWRAP